ncbi:MAG: hypothetical protein KKA07_08050 [Bacteroidetes bacterium]|nr:hypothetical protein [Bacteroidota bacterium]
MENLKKSVWPAVFTILGLLITIVGLNANQSGLFLIGGITIIIIGALSFLLFFEKIKPRVFRLVTLALIPIAVLIAVFAFQSVDKTIVFDSETRARDQIVISRLIDIRTAQMYYKAEKNSYASTFEDLISFVTVGKLRVIRAIGAVPDSLLSNPQVKSMKDAEALAIERGYIRRDTMLIPILDTLVKQITSPVDSLCYIPFSGGARFTLSADTIEQGFVRVPVFEVFASYDDIYKGLDEVMIKNKYKDMEIKGLRLGDMTKPITTGNWE